MSRRFWVYRNAYLWFGRTKKEALAMTDNSIEDLAQILPNFKPFEVKRFKVVEITQADIRTTIKNLRKQKKDFTRKANCKPKDLQATNYYKQKREETECKIDVLTRALEILSED